MTTATFRPLTIDERSILDRLMEADFPGRDALRAQLVAAHVRTVDPEGSFEIRSDAGVPAAGGREPIAVEGWYRDDDGIVVNLALFVRDGRVHELEIYKDDGSAIRTPPSARNIDLSDRWSGSS